MAQKVGLADFKTIAITYSVIMLLAVIIQLIFGSVFTLWMPWLFTFIVSLVLRMKVGLIALALNEYYSAYA
jgi:ABC-type transport system involved in cytochrome bd biosynthesis fused ATPase/permease subunit